MFCNKTSCQVFKLAIANTSEAFGIWIYLHICTTPIRLNTLPYTYTPPHKLSYHVGSDSPMGFERPLWFLKTKAQRAQTQLWNCFLSESYLSHTCFHLQLSLKVISLWVQSVILASFQILSPSAAVTAVHCLTVLSLNFTV